MFATDGETYGSDLLEVSETRVRDWVEFKLTQLCMVSQYQLGGRGNRFIGKLDIPKANASFPGI